MHFVILIGSDAETRERLYRECSWCWERVDSIQTERFQLVYTPGKLVTIEQRAEVFMVVSGWLRSVRHVARRHNQENDWIGERILHGQWPLDNDVTGDFSGLCVSQNQCVLFSGPFSIYPLYVCKRENGIVISTAMLPVARTFALETDPAGVVQSATPPFFSAYGDRTHFKGLRRVLPGEWRKFTNEGTAVKYDNTLFAGEKNKNTKDAADEICALLCRDTETLLSGEDSANIGMSGGLDSRVVLAAATHVRNSALHCYTYSDSIDTYEVQLAMACAQVAGASFQICDISNSYYPSGALLRESCRRTEALFVPSWYAIAKEISRRNQGNYLLFGDLFEAIPGRKAKTLMTREARRNWFAGTIIGREFPLTPFSRDTLQVWASQFMASALERQDQVLHTVLPQLLGKSHVLQVDLQADIDKVLQRIAAHQFSFLDEAVELFHWYINVRPDMARQMLVMHPVAAPVSPSQSVAVLRAVSNVDIRSRVMGKLQQSIMRHDVVGALGDLPSTDIPFIPARAWAPLRQVAWGARWFIDERLSRAKRRSGDSTRHGRVVRTIDFTKLAQHPLSQENVRSWFAGTEFNADHFVSMVRTRASYKSRPLGNMDIVGPANTASLIRIAGNYIS